MAAEKNIPSFEDMINADRQKKKNEALASEIFGKGRRASAPSATLGARKSGVGGSLASRMGAKKPFPRSASTTPKPRSNIGTQWVHDLHHVNNPKVSRVSKLPTRHNLNPFASGKQLYAALQPEELENSSNGKSVPTPSAFSIRGTASPTVVIAEGFAPRTTAGDIAEAMSPHVGDGLRVVELREYTTGGIAEIEVPGRQAAERLVDTFHNALADGRKLNVYISSKRPTINAIPTGPKVYSEPTRNTLNEPNDYWVPRESRSPEQRRANVEYQDGSYGFERDSSRGRGRYNDERRLYSDEMVPNNRGRR